ncbi:hypothetical protein COO91_02053 [Nostoc flagelliforme CCNUN1]|uniref:Uncharacterized protein n=1 Tax=Nostoc flagelliforme CCNUN1 TaxID=2038116 RepID=A0A2K8SL32_9NOSO|nr:hypothetical protein [Nostoc flagelliforme]AUB36152.1 hypothetical protein COO91_02053 [Nostoc flagelliforme CCNUN1]
MINKLVNLTKKTLFWRYDGDPAAFDISDSSLRLLLQTIWVDENNEVYQSSINFIPVVDSVSNFNLELEFQSIQAKTASLLPPPIDNGNELPEGFSRQVRIWRYQGEILDGDINQTQLELLLDSVLVDGNGVIYNPQPLPKVSGNIVELNLLTEFESIQSKLSALLNSETETKTVELQPVSQVWRYQALTVPGGKITEAITEFYVNKALKDIATGDLYKVEEVPTIRGLPSELGLLPEFQALQDKLETIIQLS